MIPKTREALALRGVHRLSAGEELQHILLNGNDLTIDQLLAIAAGGARVGLTEEARERVRQARKVVEEVKARGDQVYGLNTELGSLLTKSVPEHELEQFQVRTLVGHTVGWGTELDTSCVRAMIATRVNGIAKGGAGVRLEVAEKMLELLNKQVHPIVVSGSSVGQADLSEMSQIAQVLVGLGQAEYQGQRLNGGAALVEAGIMPLKLAAKEALALMSANGVTLGQGTMVLERARNAMHALDISAALALEAFGGNLSVIEPAAARLKPHPGYVRVVHRLRKLLTGSYLWEPGAARNLQDPLSFRCVPQVHGALDEVIENLRKSLEVELNSAADNPLVCIEERSIISTGNFDVTRLAIGFDTLRITLIHVINLLHERIQKQMWSYFSGLPPGLEQPGEPLSYMNPLARTMGILVSEAQTFGTPASIACRVQISAGVEDYASAAPLAILQTQRLLYLVHRIIALELIISCSAIVLRKPLRLGKATGRVFDFISAQPWLRATDWPAAIDRLLNSIGSGELVHESDEHELLLAHLQEVVARSGVEVYNGLGI